MYFYEEDRMEDLYEEIAEERGTEDADEAMELFRQGWDVEDIRDRFDY